MWRWCAVVVLGTLQAFGSTGSEGPGSEDPETPEDLGATYNANRQDLIDTEARLLVLADTSEANLPTSGSATYEGQAGVFLDNPVGLDRSLVGDATVTADFRQGTISGQATDFIGTDEVGLNVDEYDGTLSLSSGQIGTSSPSGASSVLSGTLTSEDHVVAIDAQVQGGLVGNPDVEGVALYGTGGIATVDGQFASGLVGIVAER